MGTVDTLASLRHIIGLCVPKGASQVAQWVKNLPGNAGDAGRCRFDHRVRKNPLEQGMATHSSILAWRIPMDRGAWRAIARRIARYN